jgi:hypothetical protein
LGSGCWPRSSAAFGRSPARARPEESPSGRMWGLHRWHRPAVLFYQTRERQQAALPRWLPHRDGLGSRSLPEGDYR